MQQTTTPNDLQAISPVEAARLFFESKGSEWAEATEYANRNRLNMFLEWLASEDIEDMRDVSARTVHRFRLDIKEGISQSTLRKRMGTVRQFLRFCVSIDGLNPSVPERMELPAATNASRDTLLDPQHAEAALESLEKFDYASKHHAILALCWHTGIRTGTIRALDVDDVEADELRLRVRHRPETDTPLKNAEKANRYIALSEEVTEILQDYIAHKRIAATDDYERKPLFAIKHGRPSKNTLRKWFHVSTQPCMFGECPHSRDPQECDAAGVTRDANQCPSSVSGHPIRRGAITHFLRKDVPEKVVSDRMNVSTEVLEKHYDRRTEDEKAEQRREYLDGV